MVHVAIGPYRCEFSIWTPEMGRVFSGLFAYDTETTEIDERHPEQVPTLVIGTASDGKRGVLLARDDVESFFDAHAGVPIICHNAAFDLKVTQHVLGDSLDLYQAVEEGKVWDTLILHRLLTLATEGHTAQGESSLARCAKTHLGVDLDKDVQDARGQGIRRGFAQFLYRPVASIPADYLRYAAGDALVTWHLFWKLNDLIRDVLRQSAGVLGYMDEASLRDAVRRHGPLTHHLQLRASIITDVLRQNGIGIHRERAAWKLHQVQQTKGMYEARLRAGGMPTGGKGADKVLQALLNQLHEENPQISMRRTPKDNGWSTTKEDLADLAEVHPLLDDYVQFKAAEKLISTYLSKMNVPRLHARFNYLLTTGRTSCSGGFNLQNLPKEPDTDEHDPNVVTVRGCFIPQEGHVFIDVNFSQIELVVLGYVLRNQLQFGSSLYDLINSGEDVHRRIASLVLNKPLHEITKKERNSAKPVSFGRPGGMGVRKLQQLAKENYGQELTFEEVQQRIDAYHRLCPELTPFLDDEQDTGLAIAEILHLTPADYYVATDIPYNTAEEPNLPQGWLGGMLLKVLRDPQPATQGGMGRFYTPAEIAFFWDRAQGLSVLLDEKLQEQLRGRQASERLWEVVRNNVGRRPVMTVTGRLRANAPFCASRNCLFQGVAADGMIYAMWRLWRAGYKLVNAIHDQVVVEYPADGPILEQKAEIERLMVAGMLTVIPGMNVRVETVISRSLDKRDIDPRFCQQ